MNKEEALKQIQEISHVIESSNQFFMSGFLAIAYGLGILLVPIIEKSSKDLTLGFNFGEHHLLIASVIHAVFYVILFYLIRVAVEKTWRQDKTEPSHPLLARALAFHRPVVVAACGIILIFGSIGLEKYVAPLVLILFGIIFNIYGRLSSSDTGLFIRKLSWSYIILGSLFGFLVRFGNPDLWIYFDAYLGISFVVMGILLRKEKAKEMGH
jgi:hypothetical protein